MRISYSCPSHLKFHMTVEHWSGLVQMTGEGIDWLNAHERMYDIWMVVAYAATSAALVQVCASNCLPSSLAQKYFSTIHGLEDRTLMLWPSFAHCETASGDGKDLYHPTICLPNARYPLISLSAEKIRLIATPKTAEIITLLYEATQGPPLPIDKPPALNPTGGVIGKPPPPVNSLRYKKDPSRQGSGVFIAHGVPKENYQDIPRGVIIPSEESKGESYLTFAFR